MNILQETKDFFIKYTWFPVGFLFSTNPLMDHSHIKVGMVGLSKNGFPQNPMVYHTTKRAFYGYLLNFQTHPNPS